MIYQKPKKIKSVAISFVSIIYLPEVMDLVLVLNVTLASFSLSLSLYQVKKDLGS